MRMRGQAQKRVSAGYADVGARLDAPWGVQPYRWIFAVTVKALNLTC